MISNTSAIGNALTRFCTATAFLTVSIWLFIYPAYAESRVALVVGNGTYHKVPTLPNPTRDATDISRALERLNFKVTQLTNASAAEMRKALVDFGRVTEGSEIAVVFYAGHGMEVSGENWLIPTDAELRSDTDVESEAVSLRSLNLQVSKARQLGLVILDACRNNPFAAKMQRSLRTRAVPRGLAPTEPTDNVLVAYAARDGTTANDGDGRNSPFTAALLRNIETPGLEISFLFRNVRDEVMSATKREQQPFVYGSLSKEAIYLKPLPTPAVQTTPGPTEAPATTEDEQVWKAIRTSRDTNLYEDFLKRFAYSPHAAGARQRLADLKSTQVAAVVQPAVRLPADQNAAGDIPRLLVGELHRVGCSRGINDGNWNIGAQRSLRLFNENAKTTFDTQVASLDALQAVRSKKGRVCPLTCERGYQAKGEDCVEIVCKVGFKVGDSNSCEKDDSKQPPSSSVQDEKRNLFTPEDAQRVAAMGTQLKLKMPPFAIGETKVDVPTSFRRYVGIWVLRDETGKDRQRMLILTEVSGSLVLGYHVYGPPGSRTNNGEPAGYVFIAGKISDKTLRFDSGKYPVEVRLSDANAMTMQFTNPDRRSKGSVFDLTPLWQMVPLVCKAGFKVSDDKTCQPNKSRGPSVRRTDPPQRESPTASTLPSTAGGSSMEDRYRACRKLVKGFARREACARTGSI